MTSNVLRIIGDKLYNFEEEIGLSDLEGGQEGVGGGVNLVIFTCKKEMESWFQIFLKSELKTSN